MIGYLSRVCLRVISHILLHIVVCIEDVVGLQAFGKVSKDPYVAALDLFDESGDLRARVVKLPLVCFELFDQLLLCLRDFLQKTEKRWFRVLDPVRKHLLVDIIADITPFCQKPHHRHTWEGFNVVCSSHKLGCTLDNIVDCKPIDCIHVLIVLYSFITAFRLQTHQDSNEFPSELG